jgi:ABC-type glycerol-3-phosphate transport system substrate-binding protein
LLILLLIVSISSSVSAQERELSGELEVFLQSYYPPDTEAPIRAVAEEIVADYQALHPGVTIRLVPNLTAGVGFGPWLTARMAAGTAPDIVWEQFFLRNTVQAAQGWWVPLTDFLEMPNPYIEAGVPGSERWSDSLPDFVLGQTRAADGNWYQVSLDWVETALYYNRDLFEQAGVEAGWESWHDFVNDMQNLRETTGADPLGAFMTESGWSNWYWADSVFLSAAWADVAENVYMEKYSVPGLESRQFTSEEIARAIVEGELDATDSRMDDYLRLSKEFATLLPFDYNSLGDLEQVQRLFLSQQAAAFWGGSWNNPEIRDAATFEWGVTYLPPFTSDDASGAAGVAYRVGGPSSAGQYGIPQSTADEGKLELAVDFLMFLAAPQNFGRLALSLGSFIPMVAGVEAMEIGVETSEMLDNFAEVAALPDRLFTDPPGRLAVAESGDQWASVMQTYFLDRINEEQAKEQLQQIWMNGALQMCAELRYEWCPAQ